jgi:protein-L-isoaspartate(D-aspartate) O-methyltransferase
MSKDEFAVARERMVRDQILARGIRSIQVLEAMRAVPRHLFVPPDELAVAYADGPLPIGHWQTISQPYIVALMTELLELNPAYRVLEVGTGSGYQTAILSRLAGEVHSVELLPDLAEQARGRLGGLGCTNVSVHTGDGSQGWPEAAPYDRILVTACAPQVPQPLLDQLADPGRLVLPVGARDSQRLEVWTRRGMNFNHQTHIAVAFVPLRGEHGWK